MPSILAITQRMEPALLLDFNDLADRLILNLWQVGARIFLLMDCGAFGQEFGGAEEGA
jgi:hypothetical protein